MLCAFNSPQRGRIYVNPLLVRAIRPYQSTFSTIEFDGTHSAIVDERVDAVGKKIEAALRQTRQPVEKAGEVQPAH